MQKTLLKKQEGVLAYVSEQSDDEDDEINLQDFFHLSEIKEKERVLAELLDTRKMPSKKPAPGEAATFLT